MLAERQKAFKVTITKEEEKAIRSLYKEWLDGKLSEMTLDQLLLLLECIYNGYPQLKDFLEDTVIMVEYRG